MCILFLVMVMIIGTSYVAYAGQIHNPVAAPSSMSLEHVSTASMAPGGAISPYSSGNTYAVTFNETGLPQGNSWYVAVNGSQVYSSVNNTVSFMESNGSYSYYAGTFLTGYLATPETGTINVSGGDVNITVVFAASAAAEYYISFYERGLPSGTEWSVALNGNPQSSTYPEIPFQESNGTYNFTANATGGYAAYPSSGSVVVNGSSVGITIYFYISSLKVYEVNFTAGNLMPSSYFQLRVANSSNNNQYYSSSDAGQPMNVYLPVGSYIYTATEAIFSTSQNVSYPPGSAEISYSHYLNVTSSSTVATDFPTLYAVTFTENNLPPGTDWAIFGYTPNAYAFVFQSQSYPPSPDYYVVFNSTYQNSSSTVNEVIAYIPNGTYHYRALTYGYNLTGTFNVTGHAIHLTLIFPTPVHGYNVIFMESGLPTGTEWAVTFNGRTASSNGTSISFSADNGTYQYEVGVVGGYAAHPSSGNLSVIGSSFTLSVVFTALSSGPLTSSSTLLIIAGGSAAVVLAGMALTLTARRRNRLKPPN